MPFKFYPPAGELKFWSALWLFYGLAGSLFYGIKGIPLGLVLTVPVGLLTLGIWLRVKWCGQLLGGLLILACVVAVPLVFRNGFDWWRLARIGMSGYFAWLVFGWVVDFEKTAPD